MRCVYDQWGKQRPHTTTRCCLKWEHHEKAFIKKQEVCGHRTYDTAQKQACLKDNKCKKEFKKTKTASPSWFTSLSLLETQHDGGPSTPIFQKLRPGCLMRAYPSADILSLDRPLAAPKEQATQRISLHTRANAVKLSERSKLLTPD